MYKSYLDGRVGIVIGDLTAQNVDAIVNAANESLLGGGGVDGAIHRQGGPEILEACREIRRVRYPAGLPVGEAVITTAGRMPARHVIHTVGPVYGMHDGREAELLANCYLNSLQLARECELDVVAFPAISTGVFGYPMDEAAHVVSKAIGRYFVEYSVPSAVRLVFFSASQAEAFVASARF